MAAAPGSIFQVFRPRRLRASRRRSTTDPLNPETTSPYAVQCFLRNPHIAFGFLKQGPNGAQNRIREVVSGGLGLQVKDPGTLSGQYSHKSPVTGDVTGQSLGWLHTAPGPPSNPQHTQSQEERPAKQDSWPILGLRNLTWWGSPRFTGRVCAGGLLGEYSIACFFLIRFSTRKTNPLEQGEAQTETGLIIGPLAS